MSLEESLRIEQANDVPTDALETVTSKIRRRFFEGDALSAAGVIQEYHCSNGLLSITVKELRALGYNFSTENLPGENGVDVTAYMMTNPSHWPEKPLFNRLTRARTARQRQAKTNMRAQKAAKELSPQEQAHFQDVMTGEVRPQRRPRGKPPLPVLPQIGSELRVVMVAIDEESGAARIGLKNGTVSWEVLVEAQS